MHFHFGAVLVAILPIARAQTTFVAPCVADNTLYESITGSLSNGAGPGLYVGVTGQPGVRRALVRFDLSSLPTTAIVLSAEVRITTVQSAYAGPVQVFGHRVLQAWGEGTSVAPGGGGGGTQATTGDATWLHTFYPTSFWNNAGGDFAQNPSFTILTQPFGNATSMLTNPLVADVQSWVQNPATNFGWLLKTSEATAYVTRKIDSRQVVGGTPPTLVVRYATPGQTASIGTGCPVGTAPFAYSVSGTPSGGSTLTFTMSNAPPGQIASSLISLAYAPAGSIALPQCSALLVPNFTFVLAFGVTNATGGLSVPFAVPSGWFGAPLFSQAAALDPANPLGFTLSNAVLAVLL
ncbi:MAG: DNRLRE domain-containing protein [Planctomycetota bacterium]